MPLRPASQYLSRHNLSSSVTRPCPAPAPDPSLSFSPSTSTDAHSESSAMTFADLRALHAVIGAAIDDIERVYRPPQSLRRPSSSSNPHSLGLSTGSTSSFHSARSSSHTRSSLYTDSDVEEEEDDDDMPLTPISASNAQIHPSNPPPAPPNSVRFASTNKRTFGRVRERAHTISSLPQPNVSSPGTPPPMPPPILKQPPLDFPSLDVPLFVPITPPSSRPSTDSDPSVNEPPSHTQVTEDSPPSTNTTSPQIAISPTVTVELENVGPASTLLDPTLRQREWKKKCEDFTSHPDVIKAVNKIVAACGQLSASVQKPFLTVCDAAMGYHLPSCMRFLEAAHIVEMLREAGPGGLHVSEIAKKVDIGMRVSRGETPTGLQDSPASRVRNLVDPSHLSHILRLLATHHITREVRPDVFANNRISSVIDSGKSWQELIEVSTKPESKYEGSDGIAAFVGLCTDELFKASAYLTDCYLYPPSPPSPRQSPPSRSAKHDLPQKSIPPVPPLPTACPPRARPSSSSSTSNPHRLGMYTPNDSRTSLASLVEHEREGETGGSAGAMTFASNPYPAANSGTPSKSRSRGRSVSHGPVTPPTPTSNTPSHRPGILKRLSSRSNLSVPSLPPPPMPATPKSPVTREAPETPRSRATSTSLVRQGQGTPKSPTLSTYATFRGLLSTPRATPNRSRAETTSSTTDREEALRTPRSTPSRESFASSIHSEADIKHATPRWTPSRESLRSLAKKGSFASLRPRRPDPVSTPEPQDDGLQGYGSLLSPESSQGSLGPAFDLRPPGLTSPRNRTFPGSLPSPISTHAHAVDGLLPPVPHKYTVPPPLPLKSVLRTASSSGLPSPIEPFDTKTSPTLCGPIQGAKKPRSKEAQLANEMHAPFNVAFNTKMRYFEWLEKKENEFRLKRFGKAMTGTEKWEVPGSIVGGFPWHELPNRSIVVDVGGGIGSASMLLANAFPHLRFIIQDRVPVVEMGRSAWRARCPELLGSGRAAFQAHDFFKPQPDLPPEIDIGLVLESESEAEPEDNIEQKLGTKVSGDAHTSDTPITPAVFLMRVITHDWPDSYVIRILLRLRRAAGPNTKLLLADYVLPLACADEDEDAEVCSADEDEVSRKKVTRQPLPGTLRSLAPEGTPLLANLGKANANAYWLDLTMRVMFNAQERTLRELTALTQRAGWKIVQVTRAEGSVFGHLVAIPVDIPPETLALAEIEEASRIPDSPEQGVLASSISSPQMGETFLSQMDLPSEAVIREGVATGSSKLSASKGKKRGRRERSYTFGGQRDAKDGKDSKGGEVRRGFRTLMKMLSKAQVKGDSASMGEGADAGGSKQRSRV